MEKSVLITDPIHPDAVSRLKEAGFAVKELPEGGKGSLASVITPYGAVICRTSTVLDAAVFGSAKNLRCVAIASTGFDRIDLAEATRHGVAVCGLPSFNPDIDPERDGNFVSTAEHAILLILAALGDLYEAAHGLKDGRWEKKHLVGSELAHKTVGLLGVGRIATLVARRLAPFKVRLIGYDTYVPKEKAAAVGVELVPLDEFCRQADIISVHLPKTEETSGMMGEAQFALMKDGVFIVNTARAAILDEQALVRALESGKVKRAALDVFHDEPDGRNRELIALPNVIATPHIGGSTHEAWRRISLNAAENVIACSRGEERNRINV